MARGRGGAWWRDPPALQLRPADPRACSGTPHAALPGPPGKPDAHLWAFRHCDPTRISYGTPALTSQMHISFFPGEGGPSQSPPRPGSGSHFALRQLTGFPTLLSGEPAVGREARLCRACPTHASRVWAPRHPSVRGSFPSRVSCSRALWATPGLTGGVSTSSSVWRPQESVMAPAMRGFCAAQGTQPMQLPT